MPVSLCGRVLVRFVILLEGRVGPAACIQQFSLIGLWIICEQLLQFVRRVVTAFAIFDRMVKNSCQFPNSEQVAITN